MNKLYTITKFQIISFIEVRARFIFTIAAVSIFVCFLQSDNSIAEGSCGISQITNTNVFRTLENPTIDSTGNLISFTSNHDFDIDEDNSDFSEELFLYNIATNNFIQITDSAASANRKGEISSDGTRIAFISSSNLDSLGTNTEANEEIFLYDIATENFTQVTDTPFGLNFIVRPEINADGTFIAFADRINPNSPDNDDGNPEVFLYDVLSDSFTQITMTTVDQNFSLPDINGDASRVAFSSRQNLTGTDTTFAVEEFSYNKNTDTITQLVDTAGKGNGAPVVSTNGNRIAFMSNADFTGDNVDGSFELFVLDIPSNTYYQLTEESSNFPFPGRVDLNSDGTLIVTDLTLDLDNTGDNTDGSREVFLYNTNELSWTQVTYTEAVKQSFTPSINADGSVIAFMSSGDLDVGKNTDKNIELFIATNCVSADSDGDGVEDNADSCEDSNLEPTVILDGCDSGTNNILNAEGCSILDLINEIAENSFNHGNFVSEVSHLLNSLKSAGIISGSDKAFIQSCAASADIP